MRILHYSDIDHERVVKCREYALSLVDSYNKHVGFISGQDRMVSALQLAHLLASLPEDDFDLHDKVILDLGCGSTQLLDGSGSVYEPHLVRILQNGEVCAVGFDLGDDVKAQVFPTRRVDLTDESAFDFVRNQSIDIIHSRGLVDSPALERIIERRGIKAGLLDIHKANFERILKPNGYILWNDNMIGARPGGYKL